MKQNYNFIQVSKIVNIINSCETQKQLSSCKNIIKSYVKDLKFKGVINYNDVEEYLHIKYEEKSELLKQKFYFEKENKKKKVKKELELISV